MIIELYSLAIPPADAPTNNNAVTVINIVLLDTDEQQQQVSKRDPKEKLNTFDIVCHVEL